MGSFSALQLSFRYFDRTLPQPQSPERKVTGGGVGWGRGLRSLCIPYFPRKVERKSLADLPIFPTPPGL